MQNEKLVKAKVKKLLQDNPAVVWWFMPPANGLGRSGIPDFLGCVNGKMFAVETKSGSNQLTPNQMREVAALTQAGAKCWIVRESTLGVFEAEFPAWVALCS
jgi:hypothetical protein